MTYELTDNPNIVKQIQIVESEIYIDKLEKQITDLQNDIINTPKPKTKPDEETLSLWNETIPEKPEKELKEKQDLLEILNKL